MAQKKVQTMSDPEVSDSSYFEQPIVTLELSGPLTTAWEGILEALRSNDVVGVYSTRDPDLVEELILFVSQNQPLGSHFIKPGLYESDLGQTHSSLCFFPYLDGMRSDETLYSVKRMLYEYLNIVECLSNTSTLLALSSGDLVFCFQPHLRRILWRRVISHFGDVVYQSVPKRYEFFVDSGGFRVEDFWKYMRQVSVDELPVCLNSSFTCFAEVYRLSTENMIDTKSG